MKRISLAVVVALGISFSSVASAKLIPDYRNSDFLMTTQDSVLIHLRHKLVRGICTMYQHAKLGPVAAYLNSNINFDNTDVAYMDKALKTFNKHIEEVPGLKKPDPKDEDKDANKDDEKHPDLSTKAKRVAYAIKQRNQDLEDAYRDEILALAKKADDMNMPLAQKRELLGKLQDKVTDYVNRRFGQDYKYKFDQKMAQDLQPYMDLKNPFPCLDVKVKKADKKEAKKADKKAESKPVKGEKAQAPKKGN